MRVRAASLRFRGGSSLEGMSEAETALLTADKTNGGGRKSPLRVILIRRAVALIIGVVSVVDRALVAAIAATAAARRLSHALACFSRAARRPAVVIVGGSFSALRAQRELAGVADVTLIDTKDYFEYTPGVLRLYVRPELLPTLTTPLPRARNALLLGEVTAVGSSAVRVRPPGGSDELSIAFDYLLLGCGTHYPCAPVRPTTDEVHVEARQATWDRAAASLRAASSVLILGGGLVAVELAAEIAEAHPLKPITMVTSSGTLCSSLPVKASEAVHRWLTSRGVTIRLLTRVSAADVAGGVATIVSDSVESMVCADMIYDCRGNGAPCTAGIAFEGDLSAALDARNYVRVDRTLRCAGGGGRVFGMGDVMRLDGCADAKMGHTVPRLWWNRISIEWAQMSAL